MENGSLFHRFFTVLSHRIDQSSMGVIQLIKIFDQIEPELTKVVQSRLLFLDNLLRILTVHRFKRHFVTADLHLPAQPLCGSLGDGNDSSQSQQGSKVKVLFGGISVRRLLSRFKSGLPVDAGTLSVHLFVIRVRTVRSLANLGVLPVFVEV
jgi:hypothetical protein